jgi:hypothetical protein
LRAALDQLALWGISAHQLSRVSVDTDGTLQLEAELADSVEWFCYAEGKLRFADPRHDKKIPLLERRYERALPNGMSVISYRPGRRVVLTSTESGDRSIVKGFRKGRGSLAVKHHQIATRACKSGFFRVPNLLHHDREHDFIAMERQAGSVPIIAAENIEIWRRIGVGLRSFQDSCDCTELKEFGQVDELAVLEELARRLQICSLELPPSWQAGRDLLESLAASMPETRIAASHRDLHDGQFLVCGQSLYLLDFDLLCQADTALDAGNLLAHMVLRDLQRDPTSNLHASRNCGEAFLSGLGRQCDEGFEPRCLFYQATAFFRLALIYSLRPRWQHLPPLLVRLGRQQINIAKDCVYNG